LSRSTSGPPELLDMVNVAGFALLSMVEARMYASHQGTRCYEGHGGTPLDAGDTAIKNVTAMECQAACDNTASCEVITLSGQISPWRPSPGDCYLRSDVDFTQCDASKSDKTWTTFEHVEPPPLTVITYHLFEPKYTGLENRDAGDFKGDASFIFSTFNNFSKGNPEASMEHNIIEMSEVNVTGWGQYEECNAPGADGFFVCPANQTEYCCTHNRAPTNHTRTQLPGLEVPATQLKGGSGGFWFSFPTESQGVTWTETVLRRIAGKCLGNAWRADAGGCDACGDVLDQCVADCIQASLVIDSNITLLQQTWDRVFADQTECPDMPFSSASTMVV